VFIFSFHIYKKGLNLSRKQFGNTWWGKRWLESLEKIDDTNRLSRGKRYARNDSVLEILIGKKGVVKAKVQGTRIKPYNITIKLEIWTEKQKQTILSLISERSDLNSQLITGQIPASLEEELEETGVSIFPRSWNEIEAKCSCPDWANPCKHLAAVYYMIANEIDKEPFLLFEMHGLKKDEIIQKLNLTESNSKDDILLFEGYKELNISSKVTPPAITDEKLNVQVMLKNISDLEVFSNDESFVSTLSEAYKIVGKENFQDKLDFEDDYSFRENNYHICILHRENEQILYSVKNADSKRLKTFKIEDLVKTLDKTHQNELNDKNGNMSYFKKILSFARKLIYLNAWIPKIEPLNRKSSEDNSFIIKFQPFYYDTSLRLFKEYLDTLVPGYIVKNDEGLFLSCQQTTEYILTMLITHIVRNILENISGVYKSEIEESFYTGIPYIADKFEKKQTKKGIQNIIEPLFWKKTGLTILLNIRPLSTKEFGLEIMVKNQEILFSHDMLSEYIKKATKAEKDSLLKQLAYISRKIPFLIRAFQNDMVKINPEELISLILSSKDFLYLMGIEFIIPKNLKSLIKPKISLSANLKKGNVKNYFNMADLMEFKWVIGNEKISMEEFQKLATESEKIVKFKDNYYIIDPNEARQIIKSYKDSPNFSTLESLRHVLSEEINGNQLILSPETYEAIEKLKKSPPVRIPKTLNAQLREYQKKGFRWIYSNLCSGFNICLADDMGLGKTIQVISVILKMMEKEMLEKPVLIICPTSVLGNWSKEIEKFAPSLTTTIFHGYNKNMDRKTQVYITTYGTIRSEIKELKKENWSLIVLDEAQNIKNPNSLQSKAISGLSSKHKIAMSGTPIENNLMELWSIFNFLMPNFLSNKNYFKQNFVIPIEKFNDTNKVKKLQNTVGPFIMRRLKSDKNIISDLPEKIVAEKYTYLTPIQEALYIKTLENEEKIIFESEGIQRKGRIFWLITALKQICNHPSLFTKTGESKIDDSGKLIEVIDILDKVFSCGEKSLLFTQYRQMGELLYHTFQSKFKFKPLFLHGGITRKKREEMIDKFQNEDENPLFIITLKAGGTGLNLTAAQHVIHYDLWWNPAVEDQATDRAYRIGQKSNVQVHRLITLNTFEERINQMLNEKRNLSENILSSSEKWITELSNEELKVLFSLT